MSTASQGLSKALARAGSSVVAIAEMTAADLLAQMSDEQKAELAASMAPAASAAVTPTPSPAPAPAAASAADPAPAPQASSAAEPSPFAAAHARFQTVLASEHYAGNEALAQSLLGNEKLSATEIVAALATVKKPDAAAGAAQVSQAREDGQREGMQVALAQTGNSQVDAGPAPEAKAAAQKKTTDAWARAYGAKE